MTGIPVVSRIDQLKIQALPHVSRLLKLVQVLPHGTTICMSHQAPINVIGNSARVKRVFVYC